MIHRLRRKGYRIGNRYGEGYALIGVPEPSDGVGVSQASDTHEPVPAARGDAHSRALALVARWEHGDETHRAWLRSVAVPDIEAALLARGGLEEARERVIGLAEAIIPLRPSDPQMQALRRALDTLATLERENPR